MRSMQMSVRLMLLAIFSIVFVACSNSKKEETKEVQGKKDVKVEKKVDVKKTEKKEVKTTEKQVEKQVKADAKATPQAKKPLMFKGEKLGANITLAELTQIGTILKDPKNYVGKKVLVKGTVTSVCARRGCWMEIVGENPGERIRIKVRDGVIVFPATAKGKDAVVEGEVFSVDLNKKHQHKHDENEKGHKGHDHSGCQQKVAEGTKTIYLIKGLGAVLLAE